MTNDLTAAVAEIQSISIKAMPFRSSDFEGFTQVMGNAVATILNAVAFRELVPAADVQGLVEAAKWLRGTAQAGFRTADFHRGECSCPRCAEDALFAALTEWENRNG